MALFFKILVLLGFLMMTANAFVSDPWPKRIGWICWLVAALMWALGVAGAGA